VTPLLQQEVSKAMAMLKVGPFRLLSLGIDLGCY
jgi:hypothetical protein